MEIPPAPSRPTGSMSMGEYLAAAGVRPDGLVLLDRNTPSAYTDTQTADPVTRLAGPPSPRLDPMAVRTLDRAVEYLRQVDPRLFEEVWQYNTYRLSPADLDGRVVVDLGSNLGLFTALVLYLGAASVIMVEPSAEMWAQAEASGLLDLGNLHTVRAAAGDSGAVRLQGRGTATRSIPDAGGPVSSQTLQELLPAITGPAVLKVDTEGAEYRILYGAPPELLRRFEVIWIEIHATEEHPQGPRELTAYLTSLGFDQVWEDPLYVWYKADRSDMRLLRPEVCTYRFNRKP